MNIKRNILIFLSVILVVFSLLFVPQQIAFVHTNFYNIKSAWVKRTEYNKIHKSLGEEYLLLEYGSINFKNYSYYLINFDDKYLCWNICYKNSQQEGLRMNDTNKIKNKMNILFGRINKENMIFDTTVGVLDDSVYIVTYKVKNRFVNFGTYSLKFFPEQYLLNFKLRNICKKNKLAIKELIGFFDNETKQLTSNCKKL